MSSAASAWFLGTSVRILVSCDDGGDGLSVIESRAPEGDSPPLHVHVSQDELFHVHDGELRLRVGGEERRLGGGEAALAPAGVPHTYRVESPSARWLVTTSGEGFERFVRTLSRPAEHEGLPRQEPPTPEQVEHLGRTAAAYGIELVGPPLDAA